LKITSAHDQYPISALDPNQKPTPISWTPIGYQKSHKFTLNYSNYIKDYPYDNHKTTVLYTQKYTEETFTSSSSPSFYTCPNGGSVYGATCLEAATCPTGSANITAYGTICSVSPTHSNGTYSCPSGFGLSTVYGVKTCLEAATCPTGPGLGTNPTSSGTFCSSPATANYDYSQTGTATTTTTDGTYTGAPILPEICQRAFSIQPPSSTEVNSVTLSYKPNTEIPNGFSVSANIQAKFYFPSGDPITSIRHPFQVSGINYIGTYYIEHANGLPPTLIQPLDTQTFTIGSRYTPGIDNHIYTSAVFSLHSNLQAGDQICARFSVSPAQGQMNEYGTISTSSGTINSSPIASPFTMCTTISAQPYTRVYGNDVMAGAMFADSSFSCNRTAQIEASSTGKSSSQVQPIGSGTQFAAMSLGSIYNFASAFLRSIAPTSSVGLTFANTHNTSGYGGNFNSSGNECPSIFNYYANRPTNETIHNGITSPYTLNLSGKISGNHVRYIDGNVYIDQNINYAPATFNPSNGTLQGTSLYVIALGNIYIAPNVTHLDGIYVAENKCDVPQYASGINCSSYNSSNGGQINTCATSTGSITPSKLYHICENQLTISGSLIADQIKLDRTYGTIEDSSGGENPFLPSSTHTCSLGDYYNSSIISSTINKVCAAQLFNFNPENYAMSPDISSQNAPYDSIVSLPPVL
jgi:hypothetical protein